MQLLDEEHTLAVADAGHRLVPPAGSPTYVDDTAPGRAALMMGTTTQSSSSSRSRRSPNMRTRAGVPPGQPVVHDVHRRHALRHRALRRHGRLHCGRPLLCGRSNVGGSGPRTHGIAALGEDLVVTEWFIGGRLEQINPTALRSAAPSD